jgi:RND family efflux transporter MFP subunit
MSRKLNTCWLLAVGCLLLAPAPRQAQGATPEPPTSIEAITKPSQDVKLGFVRPGILGKLLVKEGQSVKEGELLVQQDDSAEQAELEQLKDAADDQTRVKAAQAQLEQKKVDLIKMEQAAKKGAATELEVLHARLDVTIAGFQLDVENFQRRQDALKQKSLQLQIEHMRIKSPFSGLVEEILMREGECGDAVAKVIRLVKIDPLWVDVPMPLVQTTKLQIGTEVEVQFGGTTIKGKVIFMAAVAESASSTRLVRVEVLNPSGRPAGERVEVKIPQNVSAAVAANENAGPAARGTGPISPK